MLVEVKRSTTEAIERMLGAIRGCFCNNLEKGLEIRIRHIRNDLLLLKDNLALLMSSIHYIQTKAMSTAQELSSLEVKYRILDEQSTENLNILKAKCQRQAKQLNFLKFTNMNIRKELNILNPQSANKLIKEIESSLKEGTSKICQKIENFYQNHNDREYGLDYYQQGQQKSMTQELKDEKKQKQQKQISEVKTLQVSTARKKAKSSLIRQNSRKVKQYNFTKKKSHQLAILVEQQGRLSQLREKYLSTDLI